MQEIQEWLKLISLLLKKNTLCFNRKRDNVFAFLIEMIIHEIVKAE